MSGLLQLQKIKSEISIRPSLFHAVFGIELFEETAVVEFFDHACVDQILDFDVADFRVLRLQEAL